jgi:DNA-binding MarR family transcriptional regulator
MSELLTLFTRAHKLLRAEADEAMSRHGVRVGQNLVLAVLWETDGLTPGELAARLPLTTPTIVNTATRMEEAGLLTRMRDPADGRLVRLYLTERARAAQRPVEEERRRLEERATATLTDEERRHLRTALVKIIEELSPGQVAP